MGITIHYRGRVRDEAAYQALNELLRRTAAEHNWPVEDIEPEVRSLNRIIDEEDVPYHGVTKGVVLYPHPQAEPLEFEVDDAGYFQSYCKTAFAPPEVHEAIVALFRAAQPLLTELDINDEGGVW